jgi:hypothetical protein
MWTVYLEIMSVYANNGISSTAREIFAGVARNLIYDRKMRDRNEQ